MTRGSRKNRRSSETSDLTRATRHNIPEDAIPNTDVVGEIQTSGFVHVPNAISREEIHVSSDVSRCVVRWKSTDVLEEHHTTISKVEE
jgi:hypothetical protein